MPWMGVGIQHYAGHDAHGIVPLDDVARGGYADWRTRSLRCDEQHDVHQSCLWHQLVYHERLGITEFQSVNRLERAVAQYSQPWNLHRHRPLCSAGPGELLFDAVGGRSNREHVLFQRGMVVVAFGRHLGVIGLIDLQYTHTHAE
jgi:hypothetical protein